VAVRVAKLINAGFVDAVRGGELALYRAGAGGARHAADGHLDFFGLLHCRVFRSARLTGRPLLAGGLKADLLDRADQIVRPGLRIIIFDNGFAGSQIAMGIVDAGDGGQLFFDGTDTPLTGHAADRDLDFGLRHTCDDAPWRPFDSAQLEPETDLSPSTREMRASTCRTVKGFCRKPAISSCGMWVMASDSV
jgi:hypothetical protein